MKVQTLMLMMAMAGGPVFAAPLHLDVYNPQKEGMFPVSSVLVSGPKEAILFDAQFSVKEGEKLVDMINASGKTLKKIVITSGDPDFYFGLEPIVKAFPDVSVVASSNVVAHIRATKDAKLKFWGPQMKNGAPKSVIVPQVIGEAQFTIDGENIELRHVDNYASYVWIPVNKAILGGTGVTSGIHVWTADTQTPALRASWQRVLNEMKRLKPQTVIPGHYLGTRPAGDQAVVFTLNYLNDFEKALVANKHSTGVVNAMTAAYPHLVEVSSLELSAKVNTGEMKW